MKKCTVCIDESGDLGVNRGSRWFVISAVIIPEENEKDIREALESIRRKLNLKEIHLRNLHDFYKTQYLVKRVSGMGFTAVNVLIDTTLLSEKNSSKTYNFACRMVIERASWYMRDHDYNGKIILSGRGTNRDGELIDYINNHLLVEDNKIAKVFTKVDCKKSREWDGLQLADIIATSMFRSYEENKFGFVIPCAMSLLKYNLYSYNGHVMKYGIKYYDESMRPGKEYFKERSICSKK